MDNLTSNQKKIFFIVAIIAVLIIGYYVYGNDSENNNITEDEEIMITENNTEEEINASNKIMVHVYGEVVNAGVVELDENSRISDAIEAAGGLTDEADLSKINLAYILEDGMKITIPSKSESEDENITEDDYVSTNSGVSVDNSTENSEKVNINKATQTELETLPGIGPSIASKIISYREENGNFSNIEEIKNVSGIGDAKFENIQNLICVK